MNYITIVIMPRSEKLVTVVSLGISEAGPRDMGEYECQVSFTNKISRQTIAHWAQGLHLLQLYSYYIC